MIPGMVVSSYLSWPGSVMLSQSYPANTVKGRICLGYRLDWDKDKSKGTSDIYIKPRLIVMATIIISGCFVFGLIRRVKTFIPKMCTSNRSHASIGGRHRRNLLTFNELAKIQAFLIFFFLIDSIIVLVFYIFQGVVTQERIFFIYHVYHMTFDLICMIVLPMVILYKSQTNFPDIWSNYTPKRINFYTTKTVYNPRRDSDNTLNCTLSSFGQAQEDVDFIVVLNGKDENSNQRHMEESSQTNENKTIMIKKITQKSIFHFESHCNTKPTEISIQ